MAEIGGGGMRVKWMPMHRCGIFNWTSEPYLRPYTYHKDYLLLKYVPIYHIVVHAWQFFVLHTMDLWVLASSHKNETPGIWDSAGRNAPWALPISYYYFRKMWQMPVCCTENKLEPLPLSHPAPHCQQWQNNDSNDIVVIVWGIQAAWPHLIHIYKMRPGFSWLLCELTGLRGWGRCKLTSHLLTLGFWLHQLVSINYSISSMGFAELVRFHLRN
jgi:hypothetical protein